MRGHREEKQLKRGQTIAGELEQAESESERLQERRKVHRKRRRSVVFGLLLVSALGILIYTTGKNAMNERESASEAGEGEYVLKVDIVDEDNRGRISARTKEYAALLEQDLRDLGYTATQFVLPTGTSRELYVDLQGEEVYFKVNMDRDAAVTAEDIMRVVKYLHEHDLHPVYADVRVEGKAYYK